MMSLVTLGLCLAGFAGLALGSERVCRRIGVALSPRIGRGCRRGGIALLALAAGVAIARWGSGLGLVTWCGHLSLGAGLVYLGLIRRERALASGASPTRRSSRQARQASAPLPTANNAAGSPRTAGHHQKDRAEGQKS